MPYRPLLAIAILVCTGSAFLLEMHLPATMLLLFSACSVLGLIAAVLLSRTHLIRPSAAIVMSCWVALHIPDPVSGHMGAARSGRAEGYITSVRTGRTGSSTLVVDGEVDLAGLPAVRARCIIRIMDTDPERIRRLEIGTRVVCFAWFPPVEQPDHPRLFDARRWMRGLGASFLGSARSSDVHVIEPASTQHQVTGAVRMWVDSVLHAHFREQHAAILSALVIGNREGIDEQTRSDFNRSGVAHILSVSGSHVGLIITILLSVVGPLARSRSTVIASLLILIGYAVLTGAEAPTLRACFMAGIAVVGSFRQRHVDLLNILGASTLVGLLVAPTMITSASFLLSTIATYGILIIQPQWARVLRVHRSLRAALSVNFAACGVMGLPTVLLLDSVAMLAPLANLVVVPFMTASMVCGITLICVGSWLSWTAEPIVWCCTWCLEGALWFARSTADLSPAFSITSAVLAALGNSVLLIWPSISTSGKGLATRFIAAAIWLGLLMSMIRTPSTIGLAARGQRLMVIVEHQCQITIGTIYEQYGAVFVRSQHEDPTGIPRRRSR